MADTLGLMKTRKEWTEAVANGETDLPHSQWYEQKYLKKIVEPNMEKPTLEELAMGKT